MRRDYISWTLALALVTMLLSMSQLVVAGEQHPAATDSAAGGNYVQVAFKGTVMAVDPARSTFVVNEHPIHWDDDTVLLEASGKPSKRFELSRGMQVEVSAYDTTDGYLARLVQKTSESIAPVKR
jgi:hypothetical protein